MNAPILLKVDRRAHNAYQTRHAHGVFTMPIRVYNQDIDSGRVVFMANYFKFMEQARTEWLRRLGINHRALERENGVAFVVRDMQIQYHKPAYLDDLLVASVEIHSLRQTGITLKQSIQREALLCEAVITTVCVDVKTFKPVRIPALALRVFRDEVAASLFENTHDDSRSRKYSSTDAATR